MRCLALTGMALLAGCEAPSGGEDSPSGETAAEPVISGTAVPKAAAAEPRAVVYAQGVSFGTRRMPFRTARKVVENEARTVFPDATFEIDHNSECGAGPMEFTSFGPLTLNFQDGRLVGWFMEQGPGMVTSDGIRPGITLADLRSERSVRLVEDSTLDGEFEYAAPDGGTIGGFALGEGDSAEVASLFAGTNCFFR